MTDIDAIFLGLAFWALQPDTERAWVFAIAPLTACCAGWIVPAEFQTPLAAAVLAALFKHRAAVPVLLLLPGYPSMLDALQAAGIWCVAWLLFTSLESRIDDAAVPRRLRYAPIRLMLCAVLYFTLLPLHYL